MTTQHDQGGNRTAASLSDQLAAAFGLTSDQSSAVIGALQQALSYRIQRTMLSRGGVADVTSLLTGRHDTGARAPNDIASEDVIANGNDILSVLMGGKHTSRGIAARVGRDTGVDVETVKKILPIVAETMIGRMQTQAEPALNRLLREVPNLAAATRGSPLPLPGEPPLRRARDIADGASRRRGQSPLPIPGDDIPGIDRSPPSAENPFDQLPDIIRRGGTRSPSGDSLESIIRSIVNSILGVRGGGGVISNIIRLFLIRWLVGLIRRFLSRIIPGI